MPYIPEPLTYYREQCEKLEVALELAVDALEFITDKLRGPLETGRAFDADIKAREALKQIRENFPELK